MKHLAKNYYVKTDENQFMITERQIIQKGKTKGEERFVPISFHSSPEMVSKQLCSLGVSEFVNKDWLQCVEFVNEAHQNFVKYLNDQK
jgi:hypothetical protein